MISTDRHSFLSGRAEAAFEARQAAAKGQSLMLLRKTIVLIFIIYHRSMITTF